MDYLLNNELPEASLLLDKAVACASHDGGDESSLVPAVKGLLTAWAALSEMENGEHSPEEISGEAAEQFYRRMYVRGFEAAFEMEGRKVSDDDGWWPDSLDLNYSYPKAFLTRVACAIAGRDVMMIRRLRKLAEEKAKSEG